MNKVALTALALASIVASSAQAAPRHRVHAVAAVANPAAVYFAGHYIGQDPDPFIRQKLLQDGAIADN
jgi:hypothetical protein